MQSLHFAFWSQLFILWSVRILHEKERQIEMDLFDFFVLVQGPVVTDNGNFLVDWNFDTTKNWNWPDVHVKLKLIPGDSSSLMILV